MTPRHSNRAAGEIDSGSEAVSTARARAGSHPGASSLDATSATETCACGDELVSPHELRTAMCAECERLEQRMHCAQCGTWVGMAYCDGSPTLCSDECEHAYWTGPVLGA